MPLFDREERREAARIKELGDMLDRVKKPEFWDRLIQRQADSADSDSLVRALERRAEIRQSSPATIFGEYLHQIHSSTYPSPACFDAETLQELSASQQPTPEQNHHLEACKACRQLLEACKLPAAEHADIMSVVREAASGLDSNVSPAASSSWAELFPMFKAVVQSQGLAFAQQHPTAASIVVVDDHNVIDPERWDQEPSLSNLSELYRDAEKVLEQAKAAPLCRLVVLKENVHAYDEEDYAVIRRAISNPVTRTTFLVPSRFTQVFGRCSSTIVGDDTVFEMFKGAAGATTSAVTVTRDVRRAMTVRRIADALSRSAFWVYRSGRLNPRLQRALDSPSNERLRQLLEEVAQTDVAISIVP